MPRLSNDQFNRAIGMLQAGQTQRQVAGRFGVAHAVIGRAWRRFQATNDVRYRRGGGRRRLTTARIDRSIILEARRRRIITAPELASQVLQANNIVISAPTIRRRLYDSDLHSRRPCKHPPLNRGHRRRRLEFAREHSGWIEEWRNCMFTDESRFRLRGSDGRVRVWRAMGERYTEDCMIEHEPYGGGSVTVWGGIYRGGRTELVIFVNETVNSERYLNQILLPIVLPFAERRGPNFIYMDDNARPHRAHVVNEFFEEEEITRMVWPARSPDLNPIEHVWDALGRRLRKRNPQPDNLQELAVVLAEEWTLIDQQIIDNCITSMPRRCQAVIAARGGPTRY